MKGFIQLTDHEQGGDLLIGTQAITLVKSADWAEHPYAILTLNISRIAGVAYEIKVTETYKEVLALLEQAV